MKAYILEDIDLILDNLEHYESTGTIKDSEVLMRKMETYLGFPSPDVILEEMLSQPLILYHYAYKISQDYVHNIGTERSNRLQKFWKLQNAGDMFIRIRKFLPQNMDYYFGLSFFSEDTYYSFWNDEPILATILPLEWKNEQFGGLNAGKMSRPEVRILSTLSFIFKSGWCTFNISDKIYDVPLEVILGQDEIFTENSFNKIVTYLRIITRIENTDIWHRDTEITYIKNSKYKFRISEIDGPKMIKFFERYGLNDDLLLRTSFLLLKALLLWNSDSKLFGEDACANLFFSLEGCLRLIHRRFVRTKKFEIKPTLDFLEHDLNAPGYVWMLQEVYSKRVQIVHPEPRIESNWIPFLEPDDFYENLAMARDLLYLVETGDLLGVNP